MKAVTIECDPEVVALAGEMVAWRYAAGVSAPGAADALSWARATFQRATVPMRVFLLAGWAALLLEGRPQSDATHVLGWPIAQTTPGTTVLKRRSRLGIHATLIFTTHPDAVTFSSAMVYTSGIGRIVWAGVAPVHRWAVRAVLTHASNELGRSRSA